MSNIPDSKNGIIKISGHSVLPSKIGWRITYKNNTDRANLYFVSEDGLREIFVRTRKINTSFETRVDISRAFNTSILYPNILYRNDNISISSGG
jgi:hypothetical protein